MRWLLAAAPIAGALLAALTVVPGRARPALAQMIPSTLQTIPVDTPVPPTEPPTQAPTAPPAEPTRVPESQEDREGGDRSGPPPTPVVEPTIEGLEPTRTRRPTRTPRTTATASPTPLVAGGLRLAVASEPRLLAAGQRASLRISLANLTTQRVVDLTLQIRLPESVLVDEIDAGPGLISRAGGLVRWYLPGLDAGAAEALVMSGLVARAPAEGISVCALLLSNGSPAELCAVIGSTSAADGTRAPTEMPAAPVEAPIEATGDAVDRGTLGLGVLLLGLGALGVALGLRRPPPRARTAVPEATETGASGAPRAGGPEASGSAGSADEPVR